MLNYNLQVGNSLNILKNFPDNYFQCVVTSPPYWQLRDYFAEEQIGLEEKTEDYISNLINIFSEVKRTLRDDGVCWVNLGDTYNTPKKGYTNTNKCNGVLGKQSINKKINKNLHKGNLLGIPWKFAFAMQNIGWVLRCDIIYSKLNPLPDGAKNRPTRSHEYIFMFTKSENKYFYDYFATMEECTSVKSKRCFGATNPEGTFRQDVGSSYVDYDKKNKRSVWNVPVSAGRKGHFASYDIKLIEPCIQSSTSFKGCCNECKTPYERKIKKIKKEKYISILEDGWEKKCQCETNEISNCKVLDPFCGTSTTGIAAFKYNCDFYGIDVSQKYIDISNKILKEYEPIFKD